jgi:predicted amidophosphoribosyltransferase
MRPAVGGRRILLVDDVHTTGATVRACARVLKREGAAGIDVLTFAMVPAGDI